MAISLLENLHESTFRGVVFHVSKSVHEGGRKQSKFEFVNTDRRSVQDLGKYSPVFEITGFILGGPDEYLTNRDNLLTALNSPGAGILVHPFYGSITVTTGKFLLEESTRSLGYSEIKFKAMKVDTSIVSAQGNPYSEAANQITETSIESDAQNAKDALAGDLADDTFLIPEFPANLTSIEAIIKDVLSVYNDVLKPIADNIDNALDWVNGISKLIDDVSRLLDNPSVLFANIIDSITGVDGLTNNAVKAVVNLEKLFDYGETSATNPINTSPDVILNNSDDLQQSSRLDNANQMVLMSQTSALIETMNQSSRIDFANDEDIDSLIESTDAQYNKVAPSLSENSLNELDILRTNLRILLNNQRLNTNFVITIDVQDQPLSVLTFQLYDSTDDAQTIVDLNNISDVFSIDGPTKVNSYDSISN